VKTLHDKLVVTQSLLSDLLEHKDKKANTGRPTDRERAMKHKIEEVEGEEGERMGIIGESDGVVDEMWEGKEKDINPRKTAKKIQGPYTPASLSLAFSTSQGHDCTATAAAGSCTCWTGGEYVPSGGRVKKRCRQENEFSDQTSCISSEDGGVRSKRRR